MSLLLFVKGDKGLVANRNGRFYFPDRKSNITEEGLYDCTITIDKDKYAFVTGRPVKTVMPSVEYTADMVSRELFEEEPFRRINAFGVKKIGNSIIIYTRRDGFTNIGYVNSVNDYCPILSYTDDRRDYNIRKLYGMSNFPNVSDYEELRKSAINKAATELDDDMLKKVTAVSLLKTLGSSYRQLTSVVLRDNRFIVIETEYYGMKSTQVYAYSEGKGVVEINTATENCFDKNAAKKDINTAEIANYIIENHLGADGLGKEETYVRHISFMSNDIDVVCLNGNLFLDDISEENRAKAAESFKELEAYRKKVSKKISRSSIQELVKLAPRQVLGLKGLK